jgi:zinc transport system ATP-binding protein
MSYIPQKELINNSYPLTVRELLKCARLPKETVSDNEIAQALKKVSYTKDPTQKVVSLSGGEFQRVLLAKAYLSHSRLILMDEPTKGLDGVGQDKLLELIQEFKTEKQAAILLIEHNIAQVLRHGDRLLCLNRTFHWHDHRSQLEKNILEDTYHCEFEHLLIHEQKGDILDHDHEQCIDHEAGHAPHGKKEQDK